jgi:hypothetical protein
MRSSADEMRAALARLKSAHRAARDAEAER